ncbi:MAG: glycine--tRNA ligase [Candidatus Pacebacteria bacterium]|nr:glycine--tRNA ligase [Candidatus Paceibacterota bacterium]MCD8508109.1 glycine--tRNA ligase [Candidatus Paceibacterota bacterium]MCD8527901.1 glycine--tRNA ligase [Candidatus Paceibacterota bacterium]MCD8563744.1 glycine--tRNA ligase [Candidatus Paceibacterota bacterium]
MEKYDPEQLSLETIVALAKRRGFIFPANELYGGLAGFYDYGPLGSLLKNNIKQSWLNKFVHSRTDMHLLDAAIVMSAKPLTASGHVGGFSDPLVECEKCHKRFRADQLDSDSCPLCAGTFGPVRNFNLMLSTQVGAVEDSSATAYLRPETAQGIFVNYKNIIDTMSPKVPFGVAQIGKAYRNEITPRDFLFRQREFEQMEIEFFVHPDTWNVHFEYWKDEMMEWMEEIGLAIDVVDPVEIAPEDRAHYSSRTIDFEFTYPFGKKELFGLAYRGNYDLSQHAEHSKTKLQYTDPLTNETFVPHVIEPSFGLDRAILALLCSAYREEKTDDDVRVYLELPPHIAPYKIAVSPLLKNKPELVDQARSIFGKLKAQFGNVAWDDNGNIGKRYRRQDEIGTPFCVVIDFETLEGQGVTVRERTTTTQERVALDDLESYFAEKFSL